MTRLVNHLRHNVVAYIALFVALGGTSYAAVSVANHSIVPQKFNGRYIGGYVRAWASVRADGRLIASGGGVHAGLDPFISGHYVITWRPKPRSRCSSVGNVGIQNALSPGYLIMQSIVDRTRGQQTVVQTYNAQGRPTDLPFTVALVCAIPN